MSVRRVKNWVKSLVYPGLDLHTRNRASLCAYWKQGPRDVLDAGSGNGYFSWLAYKSGARVLALNFDDEQVGNASGFLVGYKGADPSRLEFKRLNLYQLPNLDSKFDEIICYETLEHIARDTDVVREFYRVLKPGGILHLCCPYGLHPRHRDSELDLAESGGHVRAGYTEKGYRDLLEPIGFTVDKFVGIGSPSLCRADNFIRAIRIKFGDVIALPLLPIVLPFVWLSKDNPKVPFSLYVRSIKPEMSPSIQGKYRAGNIESVEASPVSKLLQ
jgi:SAM-dependent methyltransferase